MKNVLIFTFIIFVSMSSVFAQGKVKIELKDDQKPHVYIDGKKYDYDIFDLIDESKIESVSVIKGEEAIKKYNAPDGVILIKTKKASQHTVTIEDKEIKVLDSDKDPLVIIDGKRASQEKLAKMSPKNIESIEVLKGQKAMDLYNSPNGVIIVKTKE